MHKTIKDEIQQARLTFGLTDGQMRPLPDVEGGAIFRAAEARFVASPNRRWWWADFRLPATSLHFQDGQGWQQLINLVPSVDEQVWFIAEESTLPIFLVYETSVAIAQKIIGECYCFEYYLTPKSFGWILGENHSDVVFAVGEPVETNLKVMADQPIAYRRLC